MRSLFRPSFERAHRVLPSRPGWHVMFVVPTNDRLAWLRRVGLPQAATIRGRA